MSGPTTAISAKLVQPAVMQRSIRNPSSAAGIVRPAQIYLRVRAGVAVKPLGAADAGGGSVVALAIPVYAELPPALYATMRYR